MVDRFLLRVAEVGVDIQIIVGEIFLHSVERVKAGVVIFAVGKGDGIECGEVVVVRGGLVVVHALHALDLLDLRLQRSGLLGRDVGHHDLGRAVGGELLVHDGERLLCLRATRQIIRQVAFHLDPVAGKDGENEQNNGEQKNEIPLVDDHGRQLFHKAGTGLFGFVTHGIAMSLLFLWIGFVSFCALSRF